MSGKVKKSLVPFYVYSGDEDYLLDLVVDQAREDDSRDVVLLDGRDLSDVDLVSECESFSFDSPDRIIIVDYANKVSGKAALLDYIKRKDRENTSVILVAIIRGTSVPSMWAEAGSKGFISKPYNKCKPYQVKEMSKRIETEASRLKVSLDKDVPEALIKVVGTDLRLAANELRKLSYLVGEGNRITVENLKSTMIQQLDIQIYDVSTAAFSRNRKKALDTFSHLFRSMGDTAYIPIVVNLMNQNEKLVIARQMLDAKESTESIAIRLDMHKYAFQMNLLPMVQKNSLNKLLENMKTLCGLECQVKGSALSKRTLTELAILSIAS